MTKLRFSLSVVASVASVLACSNAAREYAAEVDGPPGGTGGSASGEIAPTGGKSSTGGKSGTIALVGGRSSVEALVGGTKSTTEGATTGGASLTSAAAAGGTIATTTGGGTFATTTGGGTTTGRGTSTGGTTTASVTSTGGTATGGTAMGGTATGGTRSTAVCSGNAKRCSGNTPQLCSATGQWTSQAACSGGTSVCVGDGVCGACTPDSKRCSGNTPQLCSATGQWTNQTTCGGSTPACNGEGICGACVAGARKCSGNSPQLCSSAGQWANQTSCSGTTPVCTGQGVCGCPNTGGPAMKGMTKGFCIDTTEVTQAQYAAWLKTNPSTAEQIAECSWNSTFMPDVDCTNNMLNCRTNCDNHSQNCVDWCDAYAFCKSVGKRLCGRIGGGTNQFDSPQNGSQWYEVCSSGSVNRFTYGSTFDDTMCNGIETGRQGTMVVGSMSGCQSPVAAYSGVFDLIANVAEWEDSCSGSGQTAICRARGASFSAWGEDTENCGYDQSVSRDTTWINLGFRCCAP